jgi:hypothetical protein
MRLFGYSTETGEIKSPVLGELKEVTLVAAPSELRAIAEFLLKCADGIEKSGERWEHEHLSDRSRGFEQSPQFVVFNPDRAS